MVKLIDFFIFEDATHGIFVGLRPDKSSVDHIINYVQTNNIPNPTEPGSYHVTLIHSQKYLPDFNARGKLEIPYRCYPKRSLAVFQTAKGTNALAIELQCDELQKYIKEIRRIHKPHYVDRIFRPHITISYDVSKLDINTLPKPGFPIFLDQEYMDKQ